MAEEQKTTVQNEKTEGPEQSRRIVEKHYIEVNTSGAHRFWMGVLGGIGWGVGVTLGTAALIILIGYFVSRIDWVPILGQFFQNVIDSASSQTTPR